MQERRPDNGRPRHLNILDVIMRAKERAAAPGHKKKESLYKIIV